MYHEPWIEVRGEEMPREMENGKEMNSKGGREGED